METISFRNESILKINCIQILSFYYDDETRHLNTVDKRFVVFDFVVYFILGLLFHAPFIKNEKRKIMIFVVVVIDYLSSLEQFKIIRLVKTNLS